MLKKCDTILLEKYFFSYLPTMEIWMLRVIENKICIFYYNKYMGFVNKSDQVLHYYTRQKKTKIVQLVT